MTVTTQKAVHLVSKQGPFELVSGQPIPKPGPGYVLVKVLAAALNPVDWKIQKYSIFIEDFPAVLGTDIAGEVVELGEGVTNWKKGDKIFFQGTWTKENTRTGFQQYALAEAEYAAAIPSDISVEEASTIPLALATGVVGLYGAKPLGIELTAPFVEGGKGKYAGKPIVVLGGPTSVGQIVIQLAKLSGFSPIITTSSAKHTSLLQSLGATHILDRSLPTSELASQISSITKEPITVVYDTVSLPDTQNTGYSLLDSKKRGYLITVLPSQIKDEDKKANKEVASTFGVFTLPNTREIGKALYRELTGLVERGEIKPNRVEVLAGGLVGVKGGLERLERDEVSAGKLVARPQETA